MKNNQKSYLPYDSASLHNSRFPAAWQSQPACPSGTIGYACKISLSDINPTLSCCNKVWLRSGKGSEAIKACQGNKGQRKLEVNNKQASQSISEEHN